MHPSPLPAKIRVQYIASHGLYSRNMQSLSAWSIAVVIRPVRHGPVENGKPLHSDHDAENVDHQPYHAHNRILYTRPFGSQLELDVELQTCKTTIKLQKGFAKVQVRTFCSKSGNPSLPSFTSSVNISKAQ